MSSEKRPTGKPEEALDLATVPESRGGEALQNCWTVDGGRGKKRSPSPWGAASLGEDRLGARRRIGRGELLIKCGGVGGTGGLSPEF